MLTRKCSQAERSKLTSKTQAHTDGRVCSRNFFPDKRAASPAHFLLSRKIEACEFIHQSRTRSAVNIYALSGVNARPFNKFAPDWVRSEQRWVGF